MKRRRPWKVHVRNIGPNFSFATRERAVLRALELTTPGPNGSYETVDVYNSSGESEEDRAAGIVMRRTVFHFNGDPVEEVFDKSGPMWRWHWHAAEEVTK